MKKITTIFLMMILFGILNAQTPNIVISGVYGGGGNSGSTYKNDYIELYNTTNSAVDLAGYTLYYASAAGNSATSTNYYTFPAGSTIGAKKFALIKAAQGAGSQPEWPITFDFNGSGAGGGNLAMSATDGKVLLLSAYHNLTASGSIPTTLAGIQAMANYVDYVPYGTATPKFGADLTGLSASMAAKRKYNDATKVIDYTLSVGADFVTVTANENAPRNSSYGNENQVATPTFTPPAGTYTSPQQVTIDCTTGGHTIRYTTDNSEPTATNGTPYTTPITISTTTTLKARAFKTGMDDSNVATAVYNFPVIVDVPNIAAFKAANTPITTDTYRITGNVTFVFSYKTATGNHSNYYIKDATGGLVVFDNNSATITKTYNEGDVISGGIVGKCNMYTGLFQLTPVADFPVGTPGAPVAPIELTMANLLDNFSTYESQLVRLENITFAEGTFGTGAAGNIAIYQDGKDMLCRNHYNTITGYSPDKDANYNVTGFVIPYVSGTTNEKQLAPRKFADIEKIEGFIPVENITNVPTTAAINKELTLTGNVVPTNATNKNIIWSVKDAGETNAVITGNKFLATETGTAIIKATIPNGIDEGVPFEKEFTITVVEEIKTYIITASVNNASWGTISPSGDVEVIEGNSVTFTIAASPNYKIDDVLVNGTSKGAISTHTFENVQADGKIEVIFSKIIGVQEWETQINVFPNPTTGQLTIDNGQLTITNVEIFDIYGKKVFEQKSNLTVLRSYNLTVLQPGVYFIKITTEKGDVFKKIIKN